MILGGTSPYWFHGHNGMGGPVRGVASYENLLTLYGSVGVLTDWLVMCGKNGGTTPNNILVDGIAVGVEVGGIGSDILSINLNTFSPEMNSDWAFRELIIWNIALSDEDMREISAALVDDLHVRV